jgi:hypothetical protein
MKFFQINLQDREAATDTLCQQPAAGKANVALIQEPWIYGEQIRFLWHLEVMQGLVSMSRTISRPYLVGVVSGTHLHQF